MSQEKPQHRWYQFSLRSIFLATACFGASLSGVAFYFPGLNLKQADPVSVAICCSIFSAGIGGGFGALANRFWLGLMFGTAAGLPVLITTVVAVMRSTHG